MKVKAFIGYHTDEDDDPNYEYLLVDLQIGKYWELELKSHDDGRLFNELLYLDRGFVSSLDDYYRTSSFRTSMPWRYDIDIPEIYHRKCREAVATRENDSDDIYPLNPADMHLLWALVDEQVDLETIRKQNE